ncbi:hypothetical protein C5S29_01460 [ANME-1 cluster archaeon GoMg3.2]|nr:hypothetical protein [ANME-1 cluster archaeon GoMg3.2]
MVMGVVPVCGLSDSGANSPICGLTDSGSPEVSQNFSFYAVYDRLVEGLHGGGRTHAAMSGDGNKLIYSDWDATSDSPVLYTLNADGTGLTQIALPDLKGAGIGELIIDHDGSRAFFMMQIRGPIYKVEGGTATKIFDTEDYPDIGAYLSRIQTTADGGYVYFKDFVPNDHDVWRVAHIGGSPELIIDDYLVPHDSGPGWSVSKFAISDDGNAIAFTLNGYRGDADYFGLDSYRSKKELFVRDATGGYRQLTNDEDNVEKSNLAISGDGSTIVFYAGSPHKWYSIKSDGSAMIFLEDAGYNIGGPVLNYDGTKMFYSDHKGGRLVNTDGSGGIDLLPEFPIQITADYDLCISDNGHRISFRKSYTGVYVGYLNDPDAVPDAPVIKSIAFDPPAMPRGDPDAVIVLTSEISDPQGLVDIKRTSTDELVDGRLEHYGNIPVSFSHAANDIGRTPDQTAGDGIFSSAGTPASKIDELDQMTVRMGVKDASGTVVVADTVLFIGEVPPTPTPTPTPKPIAFSGRGQEATSKFSLEKGLSIFKMTHDGDRNFIAWLFDDEGDRIDLVVSEIGEFDGSKVVGIKKQGDYLLDINADGRWMITIEQPRPSYAPPVPKTLKGKGQQASEMFHLDKGLARFEMTHDGDSNFAIWLFDDEGDRIDLVVNEIGEFDGSKAVSIRKGGIYLLDISADGNWEISIE